MCIHQRYWPVIFFCDNVFVWFWYQRDGGIIECLQECSFLFNLLEEFEKDRYKFFLIRLVEFICEAIWPWTSVCREFWVFVFRDSISLLMISLFKLSISFWFSFGELYVSRKLSISSRLSNLLAYNFSYYSLMVFLYFCSIFHFLFCLFGSSLFSSWWTWPEVCQFCLPFQRTSSWFYWFFYCLLISILVISSHLYYRLPSADFRFCLFFF